MNRLNGALLFGILNFVIAMDAWVIMGRLNLLPDSPMTAWMLGTLFLPRHALSKKTGKPLKPTPVNNARDDRLLHPGWPWKESFERRRCLIPLTAWAEAEGPPGRMTCTWYSLHGGDLFAVGGIWRTSDEWGDVYSMVMTAGCSQMSDVHDRMPIILRPDQYEQWMDGTRDEALELVRTCDNTLVVDQTTVPWYQRQKTESDGVML